MNFFPRKILKLKMVVYGLQLCCILSLFSLIPVSSSEIPTIREHQLKAVFLYRFAHFITWPPSTFASSNAPFRICIWGEDPFGNQLDIAVANEKIKGRPIKVLRINDVEEMAPCQIVFASKSKRRYKAHIFTFVKNYPVLTVSDMKNFANRGGMIEFFNLGNKVRFIIAPKAVKKASLKVSARLLQIAKIAKSN